MLKHATGMFLNARIPQGDFLRFAPVAILGLPGKTNNANTKPHNSGCEVFLFLHKLRRGKKLEKWEQEYYRKNKERVDLKKRYSAEELAEQERLKKLLGD